MAVERKRFEHALERSSSFLEAVIQQAPFGIQICAGDSDSWRITTINREAQRILGTSREEQAGLGMEQGAIVERSKLTWRTLHPDGSLRTKLKHVKDAMAAPRLGRNLLS